MIHVTLTNLARRELGHGYLVAIRDTHRRETIELHGPGPSLIDPAETVLQILGKASISYGDMAASDMSVCEQRRRVLDGLVADQLALVA